jgi:hypothetical protein
MNCNGCVTIWKFLSIDFPLSHAEFISAPHQKDGRAIICYTANDLLKQVQHDFQKLQKIIPQRAKRIYQHSCF